MDELLREERGSTAVGRRGGGEGREWEERDDRGNLWARGREMKRTSGRRGKRRGGGEGRGGGVPGVPLTAVRPVAVSWELNIRSVPIKHVEAIYSVLMAALKSDEKKKKGGGPAELKTDRN
ncbi:hypothetical protein EYF80_020480 [Liparis tanakae]|uniref:Uncharacterized protein n=1 Tax=Liparis tanakae TaxID=230148 RepID=A0A4Z2HU42_9TELE|nr:hypothetical protein EYF80_020480 [Liparis tanakae]